MMMDESGRNKKCNVNDTSVLRAVFDWENTCLLVYITDVSIFLYVSVPIIFLLFLSISSIYTRVSLSFASTAVVSEGWGNLFYFQGEMHLGTFTHGRVSSKTNYSIRPMLRFTNNY